ncbi:MAG: hypothetical protein LAP38_23375 [Acidobacteriia bacterium]|nr:hypothetical protein [Terriglobia bacterium]
MSKQEEAGLILKLFELRREDTMRRARTWFTIEFQPKSFADFNKAIFGEHSGHLRMVVGYWDMAAALVNNGAISIELFNDANNEHIGVFAKIEPLLGEIRGAFGPQFAANLEKLIDATPDGRKKVADLRERMNRILAEIANQQARAAQQA